MVTVRQATFADLDVAAELFDDYRQFYEANADLDAAKAFLQARFEHGQSIVFLAYAAAGTPVGFMQLYPSFLSHSLARAYILNDLFVMPTHRRAGVATALLDAAADYGQAMGAVRLGLNTDVGNATAQALYEAKGWKQDKAFISFTLRFS